MFCKCCLDKWLKTHNNCPTCRKIIKITCDEDDDEDDDEDEDEDENEDENRINNSNIMLNENQEYEYEGMTERQINLISY
jgi:hypothetical protein